MWRVFLMPSAGDKTLSMFSSSIQLNFLQYFFYFVVGWPGFLSPPVCDIHWKFVMPFPPVVCIVFFFVWLCLLLLLRIFSTIPLSRWCSALDVATRWYTHALICAGNKLKKREIHPHSGERERDRKKKRTFAHTISSAFLYAEHVHLPPLECASLLLFLWF